MQLRSVGGAPMQQVQPTGINPVGYMAQANTSQTFAQVLDRMSGVLYEEAGKMAVQRAQVDYFNNYRVSDEQIAMAKDGNPATMEALKLGGNFNVYDVAMKKLRTFDLAGRFEVVGDNEFQKVLADVTENRITSKQAAEKMGSVTTGLTQALANQDPEAAIKLQNTLGMRASVIMGKSFQLEARRQQEMDAAELRMALDNDMSRLESTLDQVTYVNANGETRPMTDHIDATIRQIYTRVTPRLGLAEAERMVTEYKKAARDAQINVITRELNQEQYLNDTTGTLAKIRRGELGKYSPLMIGLLSGDKRDEKAVQEIEKTYLEYVSRNRTLRDDEQKQKKMANEQQANDLMIEYFSPKTGIGRKREIANQVARLNVLSIEQLEKFLDPKAKDGDPYVFANIETRIAYGEITDPEELKRIAARAGLNGKQYQQLNSELLKGFDKDKADARRQLRRVAGVPDVASSFASKDDQHKIDKDRRLNEIWNDSITKFRDDNPGKPIPYLRLANEAENQYNATDKADANKERARKLLQSYVQDELVGKKKVPAGFVIDENTNVDDLVQRGIIPRNDKNDTAGYIQKQINILRQTSR